jgi:hypothetical protein
MAFVTLLLSITWAKKSLGGKGKNKKIHIYIINCTMMHRNWQHCEFSSWFFQKKKKKKKIDNTLWEISWLVLG